MTRLAVADVVREVFTQDYASRVAGEPLEVRSWWDADADAVTVYVRSPTLPWHPDAPWATYLRLEPNPGLDVDRAGWFAKTSRQIEAMFRNYRQDLAAAMTAATFPC